MPVHVKKQGDKWRIVESGGNLAKTDSGKARDGGGHGTRKKALAQMRVINASIAQPKDRT